MCGRGGNFPLNVCSSRLLLPVLPLLPMVLLVLCRWNMLKMGTTKNFKIISRIPITHLSSCFFHSFMILHSGLPNGGEGGG